MGDVLGIVLIAPLILVWRQLPVDWLKSKRLPEAVLLFVLVFLAGQIIFLGWFHYTLSTIADGVGDFISVLDLNGRRLYNSQSYGRIFGDPAPLCNSDCFAEIHPDDRERIKGLFNETIATGNGRLAEFRFVLPDGHI